MVYSQSNPQWYIHFAKNLPYIMERRESHISGKIRQLFALDKQRTVRGHENLWFAKFRSNFYKIGSFQIAMINILFA